LKPGSFCSQSIVVLRRTADYARPSSWSLDRKYLRA
jgi:hypothetical protein